MVPGPTPTRRSSPPPAGRRRHRDRQDHDGLHPIPSAFCGIYGLKPTYGRVPAWPVGNNDYTSHVGPMTRTVADAALMLAVMAGPDERDRTSLEGAPADYVGRLAAGVKGLRVAFSADLGGLREDDEVAAIVGHAMRTFEDLGAVVEPVKPEFAETGDVIRGMWSAHEAGNYAPYLSRGAARRDAAGVRALRVGDHRGRPESLAVERHQSLTRYWTFA